MELDKMKSLWDEMSLEVEKQKKLTDKIIMEMTQAKYRTKIGIVSKYEGIGAIICFIAAIILITKLNELDTWYLLGSGVLVVVYLITIPTIVLRSIRKMRNLNITSNNYKQTLIDYANNRKHFLLIQRIGIYLNFLLMIVALPMFVKLSSNKDIFVTNTSVWYWYVPIMTLFLIFFSRWGYKSYKSITASAEKTLRELE
jgi:multisubunit Na+/H+ antiporter MnhG subunit